MTLIMREKYGKRSKNKKGFDFENNKNFQVLFDLKKKNSSKQSGLENQNERDGNKDQPIYYSYNNLQAINNNINQNNGNNANENKPFNDLKEKLNNKEDNKGRYSHNIENEGEEIENDPYSCPYCEEVYKIIIFENKPIKVFKCFYCHNTINARSLDFYYKKYEKELIEINKKRLIHQFSVMSNNQNPGNVDNQRARFEINEQIKKKSSGEIQRIDENNLRTIPRVPEIQENTENYEIKRDSKKKKVSQKEDKEELVDTTLNKTEKVESNRDNKKKKVIVVEEQLEEQHIPKVVSNKEIKKKRVSSIEQDKPEIIIVKEEKEVDEEKREVKKQRNKKKLEEKTNFNQENKNEENKEQPTIAKKESKQRNQAKIKEDVVEEINSEMPKKETKVPEKIIESNEKSTEWVDWNAKMNARNKSERKKPRDENQIIEIEADESKERGKSLAAAFKNRKSKLIQNMDKRQEEIKTIVSNSNKNKEEGEENKSIDLKNESTAIGDTQIFNETKIYNNENTNNKKKEQNKNKKKLEEIKEYPSKKRAFKRTIR